MTRPFNFGPERDGWQPTQLRSFLTRSRDRGRTDLPLLSVNLPHGVVPRVEGDGRPAPSEDLSSYQRVHKHDFVMNQLGKPHGALGVSDYDGIISPAYFVARIGSNADPRFVHHLLRTRLYISEYERRGKFMPPSQFDISWEEFRSIPVVMPPLSMQRAIAAYLDRETVRIDALIAAKRRMVGLLDERDQAELSSLVIPKACEMAHLRYFARIQGGITVDARRDAGSDAVTRPYLRVANVQAGRLDLTDVTQITVPADLAARATLRRADVLMTEGGDIDKLGRGTVWEGQLPGCLHQNHIFAVRPDSRQINSHYLALVTQSGHARAYFESTGVQSTNLASTSSSKILDLPVPVLPRHVQDEIVANWQRRSSNIRRMRSALSVQINLLTEHRQALVTAAVTGRLDIGEAA